jgi:hypothetical protein
MKKLALTQDTVVVLKSFDDLRADLPVHAGFDAAAVNLFISGNIVPLVQEFSQVCDHFYYHVFMYVYKYKCI